MSRIPESPLFCGSLFLEDSVFESPTVVPCSLPPNHEGRHEFWYRIEWGEKAAFTSPESPPECEALLAEALETLAHFPVEGTIADWVSWYAQRGFPTLELLEAFLNP